MSKRVVIWLVVGSSMLVGFAAACTSETASTTTTASSSSSLTPTPSPTMKDGSFKLVGDLTADGVQKPTPTGDVAKARGSVAGKMTLGTSSWQATWTVTFEGMTGRVKSAAISYLSGTSSLRMLLCAPCESGTQLTTTFPSRAVAEQFLSQALAGKASIVLTTAQNPDGEIGGPVEAHRL